MAINIDDHRLISHHIGLVAEWQGRRKSKGVDMTIDGRYLRHEMRADVLGLLETLQETHCRIMISKSVKALFDLGVAVTLDFNYRDYVTEEEADLG